MLQLAAAAADETFPLNKGQPVAGNDVVAGLAGRPAVNGDLPGQNGAFGLLTARKQALIDETLVQSGHRGSMPEPERMEKNGCR